MWSYANRLDMPEVYDMEMEIHYLQGSSYW